MDALTYSVHVNDQDHGTVTVALIGEVAVDTIGGLRRVTAGLAFRWLIFDMALVRFVDSSGINFFLALHRECEVSMRRVTFSNVPDVVARVFELTQVSSLFDLA